MSAPSHAADLTPRPRRPALTEAPNVPARPGALAALGRKGVLAKLAGLPRGRLMLLEGGRRHDFGPGGPLQATVTIRHPWAFGAIAFGGTIGAAEAYAERLFGEARQIRLMRLMRTAD